MYYESTQKVGRVVVEYLKTKESFRKSIKVARREIEDETLLNKVLEVYLELEDVLNGKVKESRGSRKGPKS
jgi:hypothetical protein